MNDDIFNLSIDASKFDDNKFWSKFQDLLQKLVNNTFGSNTAKSRITNTSKSLNCGCPHCGDGNNYTKRRFNVYKHTYSYKCYNQCTHPFGSIYNLILLHHWEEHFSPIELHYIKQQFNVMMQQYNTIGGSNTTIITGGNVTTNTASISIDNGIQDYAIPRSEIMSAQKLREIRDSRIAVEYLSKRGIIRTIRDIDDPRLLTYAYNEYYNDLYIFNTTNTNDIIGIQVRHLSLKSKRRFTSYTYGDLWSKILKLESQELSDLSTQYNKMSMIWNILRIDYSKPFHVFEGTIDAYCYGNNSIACWGLSNFIYNSSALYITDNTVKDKAGKSKAIELLNMGYTVLLWGKVVEDYPELLHCKDINDIVVRYPNFNLSVLEQYYGNNPFDVLFL